MRIVYAGTPQTAVAPLRHLAAQPELEIAAVLTRPDAPVGRKRVLTPSPVAQAARDLGLEVLTADRVDQDVTDRLRALDVQAGAIVAYGALLRREALEALPLGWVNLHFSLLPRWRGAAPVQHALIAGDPTTGATVFRLDEGMDTGPILRTLERPVRDDDTAGTLLAELAETGGPLLAQGLRDLREGAAGEPQRGEPTVAPKLAAADARIDWTLPAARISALAAGVTPEPGAWTELDGARFKLIDGVAVHPEPVDLAPGQVRLQGRQVLVGAGEGAVALRRVQPAGRKAMEAGDWARGRLAGQDGAQFA